MNKVKQKLIFILLFVGFAASGQDNMSVLLSSIEENNPGIVSLRAQFDLERAEARTDLLPSNPTVEFGRFPAVNGTGVKSTWGVSQSFEFPTTYVKRSKFAKESELYSQLGFQLARQEILLESKVALFEQVYLKRMLAEARRREALAKSIESIVERKVNAGHTSILDLNNARVRTAESTQKVVEIEGLLKQNGYTLLAMNGMKPLPNFDTLILQTTLPSRDSLLNAYSERDMRFKQSNSYVNVANANLAVVRHSSLPEIEIGYESESTDSEHFQGFRAGISIPLWGNVGNKRVAKAKVMAANAYKAEMAYHLQIEFDQNYAMAQNLWDQLQTSKQALASYKNLSLLQKAVDLGEISIGDFYTEASFLYEFSDRSLELELEYAKVKANLTRFEL
jgi:outer membrane protein, heavy metal efflux system